MRLISSRVVLLFLVFISTARGNDTDYDTTTTITGRCAEGSPPNLEQSIALADVALQVQLAQTVVHGDDPLFHYARATVRAIYTGCGGVQVSDKVFLKVPLQHELRRWRRHSKYMVFGFVSYGHIPGYSTQQLVVTLDPCLDNRRLGWHDMWTLWRYTTPLNNNDDCDVLLPTPNVPETRLFGGGVLAGPTEREQYRMPLHNDASSFYRGAPCSHKECGPQPTQLLCPDGVSERFNCSRNPATGQCDWDSSSITCPTATMCQNDRDCGGGTMLCHDDGYCIAAVVQCQSHTECPGADHFCEAGRCKHCQCDAGTPLAVCPDQETTTTSSSDDSSVCVFMDGACQRESVHCPMCASRADCRDDHICRDGYCHPAECTTSDACAPDQVCHEGQCVACECQDDDSLLRQPFVCHDWNGQGNVPLACRREPSTGHCEILYSECADCRTDEDCFQLPNGFCDAGRCESAQCYNDHECLDTEVCDTYQCVPCDCGNVVRGPPEIACHDGSGAIGNVPGVCYRGDNGQCIQDYSTCPQCNSHDDCYRLKNGVCNQDGECESMPCLQDEQCGHDEVCLEYHCVQCDCGPITREERLCHDETNYENVPGPCLRENGTCVQEYSTCDACSSDADCGQVYNGVCRGGTCESAECLLSNQCNDSQECDGGFCVACDCGDPISGEIQCADGSTAGPDQCLQDGNGNCGWTYTECPVCGIDYKCPYGSVCDEYGECVQRAATECYHDRECGPYQVCGRNGYCQRNPYGVY